MDSDTAAIDCYEPCGASHFSKGFFMVVIFLYTQIEGILPTTRTNPKGR